MKKILPPLFRSGSTQRSIWRPFFDPPIPFSLATRAFYAAPLAAPSWTPLFGLFWLPCQKYYLEMEFWLIFTYVVQNCPPFPEMCPDSKSSASKKSYGRRKIRHFYAFSARIPGRCILALSPENLARLGGFGWIFDIFFQERPPIT